MPNPENLKPFQKGIDKRRNTKGAPRKYVSLLKEQGYKQSEVIDAINVILSMDLNELKGVWDNPKATILEKTVANALITSLKKGSLYSIDTLLNRVHGRPKEIQQITQDGKIEIVFTKGKTIL